jgi:hypothetical protein
MMVSVFQLARPSGVSFLVWLSVGVWCVLSGQVWAVELTILPNAPMPGPKMIASTQPASQEEALQEQDTEIDTSKTTPQHTLEAKPLVRIQPVSIVKPVHHAGLQIHNVVKPKAMASTVSLQPRISPKASQKTSQKNTLSQEKLLVHEIASVTVPDKASAKSPKAYLRAIPVEDVAVTTVTTKEATKKNERQPEENILQEDAIQTVSLSEEPALSTTDALPPLRTLEALTQKVPTTTYEETPTNRFALEDALTPLQVSETTFPWHYWLPKVGAGMTVVLGTLVGIRYLAKKMVKPEAVQAMATSLSQAPQKSVSHQLSALTHVLQKSRQTQSLSIKSELGTEVVPTSVSIPKKLSIHPASHTPSLPSSPSQEPLTPAKQRLLDALNALNQ